MDIIVLWAIFFIILIAFMVCFLKCAIGDVSIITVIVFGILLWTCLAALTVFSRLGEINTNETFNKQYDVSKIDLLKWKVTYIDDLGKEQNIYFFNNLKENKEIKTPVVKEYNCEMEKRWFFIYKKLDDTKTYTIEIPSEIYEEYIIYQKE